MSHGKSPEKNGQHDFFHGGALLPLPGSILASGGLGHSFLAVSQSFSVLFIPLGTLS